MKKKTSQEKESSNQTSAEMEEVLLQNQSMKELINLRDEAYFRMRLLNHLEEINQNIKNLELGEEESSEEEDEDEEAEK